MAYDYDALYENTPNALGEPTKAFTDFFNVPPKTPLKVLDIGCGQGRDAIFIADLGHEVMGVDISEHGIKQLNDYAQRHNLKVKVRVADLNDFETEELYDVVLIDRTLHMLDEANRLALLERLLEAVNEDGWVLIADEPSNLPKFKDVIEKSTAVWQTQKNQGGYLFVQRQGKA